MPLSATIDAIAWDSWRPQERATLLFVIRDKHILLIHKKRGLGAGKINGPGGRIEPGEASHEAALREVREELCVTPLRIKYCGNLAFRFTNGYSLQCIVFTARSCLGQPAETDEAVPLWVPLDAIPYERMWADDALWMPRMLRGEIFTGRFIFDGERMLDDELHSVRIGAAISQPGKHLLLSQNR